MQIMTYTLFYPTDWIKLHIYEPAQKSFLKTMFYCILIPIQILTFISFWLVTAFIVL